MKYTLDNGKVVNIPDEDIKRKMQFLDLSEQEAIDLYLSDEGLIDAPEEVDELTAKAKAAGVGAKATGEKKERKAPERKPDMLKRQLIEDLFLFIAESEQADKVEVTNIERVIAFEIDGEKFELTLTKKRKPKK